MQVKGRMKKSILALGLGMIMALTQVVVFPVEMMTVKAETGAVVGELTGNAECYTSINVTEEGTEITYIPGTWHTLECAVAGHDVTKQGKLEIIVKPSREGMELAIFGNGDSVALRPTWENCTFDSAELQTLVYDLDTNLESLRFYCEPNQSGLEARTFLIKSIRFLDSETGETPSGDVTGIVLDGSLGDWEYIRKMAVNTGAFLQVASCRTQDNIYLMYELSDASIYNTDQILFSINGENAGGYNNAGITYMLQSGVLYSYSGTDGGWGWTPTSAVTEKQLSTDKSIAEYKIPVSAFGANVSAVGVNIGIIDTTWASAGNYPAAANVLEGIPSYEEAHIETSSVPIANFDFTATPDLKALDADTKQGGVAGYFSAEGGDGVNYCYSLVDSPVYGADNKSFSIEDNRLVVAEKQLKPGIYKIYAKVNSDIREEKKEFSLQVESVDSSTVITEDIFSGLADEWFAVPYNQVNAAPNLHSLKAVSDGTWLYGYVSAGMLDDNFEFYIGVNGRTGADMSDMWEDGNEVAHKVDAAGHLYEYDGNEWADTGRTASVYREETGAEFMVKISDLSDGASAFKVGVMENQSSVLPNRKQLMLEVTSPIMSDAPVIVADGNPSDGQNTAPLAEGEGSLGSLYAFRDNDYLYVMTYVNGVNITDFQGVSTNLYIDSDANGNTGYQHPGYPAHSGADFLVQDWCSVTVGDNTKNTEFFYRKDNSSAWTWSVQGSGKDYKTYAATAEEGIYCVEYAIPVSDLKAVTPLISDDLYIAVDREWIADTLPAGYAPQKGTSDGKFVKVPKYRTGFDISLEDSSLADWSTIPNAVENTASDTMYNLYATCSQERLYTLVTSENNDFTTANTYYLDTDDSKGYTVDAYEGVDYVVKDAGLYPVTADNTLGNEITSVDMDYYASSIGMQVYLEDLEQPATIRIAFSGKGYDGSVYDDTTTPNKDLMIPADGSYLNVDASFTMHREEGVYYPKEAFDSFTNPYTGWVGWAEKYGSNQQSVYDYNLAYVGVRWSEFEPAEGQYNYDILETKYHISDLVAEGKRINLRFIMDNPDTVTTEKCMDIPKWLYDKLVEENGEDGAGTFYFREDLPGGVAGSSGSGFSPNYNSQILMQYHEKAIAALAEKYNNPAIVAYVQVGSLGHWGEFHTWPEGTGVFPTPEIATKYMEPYTKYFTKVKVGLRKNYPYAAQNQFGLFNDVFGVSQWAGTASWLKWIQNGCTDMGAGATADDVQNSKMPEWWKTNYSGGEFASGNVRLHLTDAGTIGCLQQVRDSHTTWLGPCSATMLYTENESSYLYKANVEAMQKLMGYRFYLRSVTKCTKMKAGETTKLDMCWENEGVAPFYYNWPLEISFIGKDGRVAYSEKMDVGISNWLPGSCRESIDITIPKTLQNGEYTVAVAVIDPDLGEPAMKLAMTQGREDLRYPLYQVLVEGGVDGGSQGSEEPGGNQEGGNQGGEVPGDNQEGGNQGNEKPGDNHEGDNNTVPGGTTHGEFHDKNNAADNDITNTEKNAETEKSAGEKRRRGNNTKIHKAIDNEAEGREEEQLIAGENKADENNVDEGKTDDNKSDAGMKSDTEQPIVGKTDAEALKSEEKNPPIWIAVVGVGTVAAGATALGLQIRKKRVVSSNL